MRILRPIFLTACLLGQAVLLRAQFMVPPLSGPVVDQAGMIDDASRGRLEAVLRESWKKGWAQFTVLTVPELSGETIESASIKVADTWKLGDKKKDNGVLIMLAKAERKIRIEVGQGLEGDLTDAFCSRVIRETMSPLLRQGRTGEAVEAALGRMLAKIGQPGGPGEGEARRPQVSGFLALFWIFLVLFFVVRFIARLSGAGRAIRRGGRGGFWGGGFGGSGGGGFGGGGFSGGGGGFSGGGSSGSW